MTMTKMEPNHLIQIRYAWRTESILSARAFALLWDVLTNDISVLVLFLIVSALQY